MKLLERRLPMPALLLAFFVGLVSLTACTRETDTALHLQGMQGTATWHVTISKPQGHLPEQLETGLEKVLQNVHNQIATWDEGSEISRFNQHAETDWFAVSPELAQLVALSLDVSALSNGAYDVTLGPLLKLWGFSGDGPERIPAPAEIQTARARTGYQQLQARLDPPALRKTRADLLVELASVADGFAADRMGLYLEAQGIQDYMVEIAGEIRTRGLSPRGDAWRIAIEKPVSLQHVVQQGLELPTGGLATSGDYRHYFTREGKRYSHTLDVATGAPVTHRLASVSVSASDTTTADAYATLLMALGEVKGKAFAARHGIQAYFVWRTEEGFETAITAGFEQYFAKNIIN